MVTAERNPPARPQVREDGPRPNRSIFDELVHRLFAPVDIASLAFFRIAFGLVCFLHVWLWVDAGYSKIRDYYVGADFHFTYPGFGWVKPLPSADLMEVVFLVMAASTVMIALGFYYRIGATIFFLAHTYIFLIDQAAFWNHYYLISLIAFLMIFVPAHRAFSLDVARGAVAPSEVAPAWALWSLRAQMAATYCFAGLAKINGDWLEARPIQSFIEVRPNFPLIGRFFDEEITWYAVAYSGLTVDLLVVPALLWRRTRIPALIAAIGFHILNAMLFDIEVFPWLAIAATLLFLAPDWPRRFARPGGILKPRESVERAVSRRPSSLSTLQKAGAAALAVYFFVQVFLPLRHYLYPGYVEWTHEGYYFAWRMMIGDQNGMVEFFATDKATGEVCEVRLRNHLKGYQQARIAGRPDMILQFAHYVADLYAKEGTDVAVTVRSRMRLNGGETRPLIDPEADLAAQERGLMTSASWIAPQHGREPRPVERDETPPMCELGQPPAEATLGLP